MHLRDARFFAVSFSLALHAAVMLLASKGSLSFLSASIEKPKAEIVFLELMSQAEPPPAQPAKSVVPTVLPVADTAVMAPTPVKEAAPEKQPASMAAPPAPTTQEWAFAARYSLKNSKGYRYSWGQQVRSMMGTAVEGPDQGFVRFSVEIAPDGSLARLETLWTTSAVAEKLARKAVQSMPPLPPTPTGKPLVFEKTIAFTPFATDGPPVYKDDCLPDLPAFRNPFAWDGQSPLVPTESPKFEKLDPQAMAECLRQLPQDSIDAEVARDRRAMERWGWK